MEAIKEANKESLRIKVTFHRRSELKAQSRNIWKNTKEEEAMVQVIEFQGYPY